MLGNKEILAKNISKFMKEKNVDRNTLSKDLNLKYTTVSDWINAKTYPRIDKIELLANYFSVSKAELIEEDTKQVDNLAAHLDGDFTEEELAKIREYAEMVRKAHRNM